jgi:hypothetical protein
MGIINRTNLNTKKIILILTLIGFFSFGYSQTDRLQSTDFLYWQKGTLIKYSDYSKQLDSIDLKMLESYSVKSLANVQIHAILDYPKKVRNIKTLREKWYIAPVFCKSCSPLIEKDSVEIEVAQIYFDIAEYCARLTRKKIAEIEQQNFGNGFIATIFPNRIEEMYSLMGEMFGSFGKQVIIDKKEGAMKEWRASVDQMLELTEDYSTTLKDCERFLNKSPFSKDYKVSYAKYGQ